MTDFKNETFESRERLEAENFSLRQMYEKTKAQKEAFKTAIQEYEKYLLGTISKQLV